MGCETYDMGDEFMNCGNLDKRHQLDILDIK